MKKYTAVHTLSILIFGLNGIVASRISLNSYSIVFFRTLIGSAVLTAVFLLFGGRFRFSLISKRHLAFLAGSGIAMGISWMFLYEAYRRLGVGLASLVYYTGPVFVVLLSPVLFREKLTVRKLICFVIVLAGLVLTNLPHLGGTGDPIGLLCGLGSAVTYAFMVTLNKKAESITGLKNSTLQLTVSFLTVAVFVLLIKGVSVLSGTEQWLWMLLLGIVNTGLGCWMYFSTITFLPVQTVSVLGYLEPLSALIFSVILLGEKFLFFQIVGAVLILGGAVLLNLPKVQEPDAPGTQ